MLVRERIARLADGMPVIVTGDLNCYKDSEEFKNLLGTNEPDGVQLLDAYEQVHGVGKTKEGTYGNPNGEGPRIDFVLHTSDFKPTAAVICREKFLGGFASDHFPVMVTLNISHNVE